MLVAENQRLTAQYPHRSTFLISTGKLFVNPPVYERFGNQTYK